MDYAPLDIADGEYLLPAGKIAMIVTHLQQFALPDRIPMAVPEGVELVAWQDIDIDAYLALFRDIGRPWLWFGRLLKTPDEVAAIFARPRYAVYRAMRGNQPVGLLELDYQSDGDVEIAYFGLVPGETGKGLGRWLMDSAQRIAWGAADTRRLWVHTCTADDPAAPAFYQKMGFRAFARGLEISDDPRALGLYPAEAGPANLPVIG
ncbi:MAG: GNAT family N-acetyltransferase [Asticcacaulis sp.]